MPGSDLFSRMNDVHGFTGEMDFLKNKYLLDSNGVTIKAVNTLSKAAKHSEYPALLVFVLSLLVVCHNDTGFHG